MENESIDSLLQQFDDVAEKLEWAKLIKNPFKRNAQIRKLERQIMGLSTEILTQGNCLNLLVAVLIPPSMRRNISSSEINFYDWDPQTPLSRAMNGLYDTYKNADPETRAVLDQIPDPDPTKLIPEIMESLPEEMKRPFICNLYYRFHVTAPINKKRESINP